MARFRPGDEVRLLFDVASDGTVYGVKRGDPLLSAGAEGFVKRDGVGLLEETIYDVFFPGYDRTVGCREKELLERATPWNRPRFGKGDAIRTAVELAHRGRRIASTGTEGTIGPVLYHPRHGYVYEVTLADTDELCLLNEQQMTER